MFTNLEWYQCDILRKDGKTDFWCRFIASSQKSAEEKIEGFLRGALTGEVLRIRCYCL